MIINSIIKVLVGKNTHLNLFTPVNDAIIWNSATYRRRMAQLTVRAINSTMVV